MDDEEILIARAANILKSALHEQPNFVKIHAAEYLLALGDGSSVKQVFEQQLAEVGKRPFLRIGVWRVLARASTSCSERLHYVTQLRDAFLDHNAPDQAAAAESLAKIEYQIAQSDRRAFEQVADALSPSSLAFGRWLLAVSGCGHDLLRLADLLDAEDGMIRGCTAYALRYMHNRVPPAVVSRIAAIAQREPEGAGRGYLLGAAYVTAADEPQLSYFRTAILRYLHSGTKDERYELSAVLAIRGEKDDVTPLATLLNDADADVQVAAAHAIICISRRK